MNNKNIITDVTKSANELVTDIIRGIINLSGKAGDYFLYDEDFENIVIVGKYETIKSILNEFINNVSIKIENFFSTFTDGSFDFYDKEYALYIDKDFNVTLEKIYDKDCLKNNGYLSFDASVMFLEDTASSRILNCCDVKTIIFELV